MSTPTPLREKLSFEQQTRFDALYAQRAKKQGTATVLALPLLGTFGFDQFYLGNVVSGVIRLLFSWTLIPTVISLFDLLTGNVKRQVEHANERVAKKIYRKVAATPPSSVDIPPAPLPAVVNTAEPSPATPPSAPVATVEAPTPDKPALPTTTAPEQPFTSIPDPVLSETSAPALPSATHLAADANPLSLEESVVAFDEGDPMAAEGILVFVEDEGAISTESPDMGEAPTAEFTQVPTAQYQDGQTAASGQHTSTGFNSDFATLLAEEALPEAIQHAPGWVDTSPLHQEGAPAAAQAHVLSRPETDRGDTPDSGSTNVPGGGLGDGATNVPGGGLGGPSPDQPGGDLGNPSTGTGSDETPPHHNPKGPIPQ